MQLIVVLPLNPGPEWRPDDVQNREQAEAALDRGRAFLEMREYERAIRLLEKSNQLCPSGVASRLRTYKTAGGGRACVVGHGESVVTCPSPFH